MNEEYHCRLYLQCMLQNCVIDLVNSCLVIAQMKDHGKNDYYVYLMMTMTVLVA